MITAEHAVERKRGSGGGVISQHRTLVTVPLTWMDGVFAVALSAVFAVLAYFSAPAVFALWRFAFVRGSAALGLDGRLQHVPMSVIPVSLPVLSVDAPAPNALALLVAIVVILALIAVSFWVAPRALPLAYFLRAVGIVLGSAVMVFAAGVQPPSLELSAYARTMLRVSAGIWLSIPLAYGLTLFLLDITWRRKAALMAIAMVYLALFIPLQHLLTLFVAQHLTLLVVPVLFVFASVIPQVAVLIALYSWGASWPSRT